MICDQCEKENFRIEEGVKICAECGFEVKGTRDERIEDEGVSRRTLVSSPVTVQKLKEKTAIYSAWTTTEAYNIIICKQVSALLNLGASDKLKDVVLHIWSRYLQECEVAFKPNEELEEELPRLSVYAKKRDLKVLYGDKYIKRKKKTKSKPIKKKQTRVSKKKSKATAIELSYNSELDDDLQDSSVAKKLNMSDDELFNEENRIEDEICDENNEINSELCDKKNEMDGELCDAAIKIDDYVYSSHAQKQLSTCGRASKSVNSVTKELCVDNMTLSKTLCFCYLGLLYTGDQLLLSDLIRFAHEGRIPYLNATSCFPSSMKLQYDDHLSFNTNAVPNLWKISLMCAKLIDFIALPKFKHRSILPIVLRFTKDLNLPDNIVQILKILLDKNKRPQDDWYETKKRSKSQYLPIPIYEVQAMAYIIIVLKMIFVLDGKYELKHSGIMEKINVLLEDRELFVWNKWKQQAFLKEYLFLKPGFAYSNFSLFDSLSADEIASKYPYLCTKGTENFPTKSNRASRSARHGIKNLFLALHSGKNKVYLKPEPTSFPLKQQIDYLITMWETLPMYKETQQIDFVFLSEDMSSHQLFFNPAKGVTSSDDLISLLLSSLYVSAEISTLCQTASSHQNILRSTSKYWFKNFSEKQMTQSAWLATLPSSFQWLLTFLCKYTHVSCKLMYSEVIKMEKELFLHVKRAKN